MDDPRLESLVKAVLKSPKYRNICVDLVRNVGSRELIKGRNLKEATKATKNKLHQIGGVYFLGRPTYAAWLKKLEDAKNIGDEAVFRGVCAEVMGYHYSTRERLKVLNKFYVSIFSLLPSVHSILDVACGFNPLSIPWMPLSGKVKYYAYDVYDDLVGFLNSYMSFVNVEGYAEARDVLHNPPEVKVDLALFLNTIPCLEQIEKSAGLKVLEGTNADFLAVSFPVRSLSGKEKGMKEFYEARFSKLTSERKWPINQLVFEDELVFLVRKT